MVLKKIIMASALQPLIEEQKIETVKDAVKYVEE